jgi:hypothetical protein
VHGSKNGMSQQSGPTIGQMTGRTSIAIFFNDFIFIFFGFFFLLGDK